MEKNNEKKKFNKAYIIIFTLALISAVLGFCDIKSHAEEMSGDTSDKWYCYVTYDDPRETHINPIDGGSVWRDMSPYTFVWEFDYDPDVRYAFERTSNDYYGVECCSFYLYGYNYVTGEYVACNMKEPVTFGWYKYYSDGNDVYVGSQTMSGNDFFCNYVPDGLNVSVPIAVHIAHYTTNIPIFTTNADMHNYLKTGVSTNELIDYDNLTVDDDMPVVTNLSRNTISDYQSEYLAGIKQKPLSPNIIYDCVTWNNTSDEFDIQLQTMNVAQFFKVKLTGSEFLAEYYEEWTTREIYTDLVNSFVQISDCSNMYTDVEDFPDTYVEYMNCKQFVSDCEKTYSQKGKGYPMFAYRVRYVDVQNKKAGPWVVLLPSQNKDSKYYVSYVEYSDGTSSEYISADGLDVEYDDLDNVESAVEDIDVENNFKDKYEIIDNEVDVQEATNWLKTVVNFIKSTPSVIGSVLGFLPQPILYGMYVVLFLGVIACGFAIVRALI